MAITSFAELTTQVGRWAGGSSDPNFGAAVVDAIGHAEVELSRRLRVPEMVKRIVLRAPGAAWIDLPADFVAMRNVWLRDLDGGDKTELRPLPERTAPGTAGSKPRGYVLSGLQMMLSPSAVGEDYPLRLVFYATVPSLSAQNACSATLLRYPELYLYFALSALQGFLVADERIGTWRQMAEMHLAAANRSAARRTAGLA